MAFELERKDSSYVCFLRENLPEKLIRYLERRSSALKESDDYGWVVDRINGDYMIEADSVIQTNIRFFYISVDGVLYKIEVEKQYGGDRTIKFISAVDTSIKKKLMERIVEAFAVYKYYGKISGDFSNPHEKIINFVEVEK